MTAPRSSRRRRPATGTRTSTRRSRPSTTSASAERSQLAVDRDAIAGAYQGQGYADFANSPFVKDSEWWAPPETELRYDPDEAKRLLADYGQPVNLVFKLLAGSQEIEDAIRAYRRLLDRHRDRRRAAARARPRDVRHRRPHRELRPARLRRRLARRSGQHRLQPVPHRRRVRTTGSTATPRWTRRSRAAAAATTTPPGQADYATVQQIVREDLPVLLDVTRPDLHRGVGPSWWTRPQLLLPVADRVARCLTSSHDVGVVVATSGLAGRGPPRRVDGDVPVVRAAARTHIDRHPRAGSDP